MIDGAQLFQVTLSSLQTGTIYALVGLSYAVIVNATGVFNFAQGEWLMAGAMLAAVTLNNVNLPYPVVFVSVLLLIGLLSLISERLLLRPLIRQGAPTISLLVMLLGLMVLVRQGTGLVLGKLAIPLPLPFGATPLHLTEAVIVTPQMLFIFVVTGLVFFATWLFFEHTRLGTASKVVAIDPEGARLMGINTERVIMLSFLAGGSVAACAGMLIAPLSAAQFTMGVVPGVKGFIAMVIGGIGSPLGALVGGLALGLAEGLAANYISSTWSDAIALVLLIVMLWVRPSGIFKSIIR